MVIDRLRTRRVLSDVQSDGRIRVLLPIFSDWLLKNAELSLLPIRRRCAAEKTSRLVPDKVLLDRPLPSCEATVPISEDDLLPLSQRLILCGKQKDVAELRSWLRQFDDDNRIEIAYALLKRLAERGYISDGEREYALSKRIDRVNAFRREVGSEIWNLFRARKDNLCISYVDSELKSGATLARDVTKRLAPGKAGDGKDVSAWMKSHEKVDPLLILVDDCSGTGSTVSKGFAKWRAELKNATLLDSFLDEGRVMFALLYSFGAALDALRQAEPRLRLFSANTFGAEVRAFDSECGSFKSSEEIDFAREVTLQIGRDLRLRCHWASEIKRR